MSKKPNVVVFFTDQQRWDTVGIQGNPLDVTPNFDRMARQGCFVEDSFTCQPVCGPARGALQTGLYPTTTGMFRNDVPLPADQKTLAHYFKAAGYETGYIGKWHLASNEPVPQEERGGYEYWLASNILEFTSHAYDTNVFDNENRKVRLPGYRVDALTDAAISWVTKPRENPFFLFLSHLEPHHQNDSDDYPAPEGIAEWLRTRGEKLPLDLATLGGSSAEHYYGYMGMVSRLDAALGRLTDALISNGLIDETVILFTSDHGCHFKTRNDEYKRSCHEASIRVPTFFHGPGFEPSSRPSRPFSLIDVAPSLLDAAGLDVPRSFHGHSILSGTGPKDLFVQISESQVGRALRTNRWKYAVTGENVDGMVHMNASCYRESHLYDLQDDPHEFNNLVKDPDHESIRAQLRSRLMERMTQAHEECPNIRPAQ